MGLSKKYEVRGIPHLVMLGPVSNEETLERPIINKNMRSIIEEGDFSDYPFKEKNYGSVETSDLQEVREKMEGKEECKFLWALSEKGMATRIRSALGMPKTPGDDPVMVMLDLPDDGGYYKAKAGDITADSITEFVANPGERFQLE